jgi:hypothetical protein
MIRLLINSSLVASMVGVDALWPNSSLRLGDLNAHYTQQQLAESLTPSSEFGVQCLEPTRPRNSKLAQSGIRFGPKFSAVVFVRDARYSFTGNASSELLVPTRLHGERRVELERPCIKSIHLEAPARARS